MSKISPFRRLIYWLGFRPEQGSIWYSSSLAWKYSWEGLQDSLRLVFIQHANAITSVINSINEFNKTFTSPELKTPEQREVYFNQLLDQAKKEIEDEPIRHGKKRPKHVR